MVRRYQEDDCGRLIEHPTGNLVDGAAYDRLKQLARELAEMILPWKAILPSALGVMAEKILHELGEVSGD